MLLNRLRPGQPQPSALDCGYAGLSVAPSWTTRPAPGSAYERVEPVVPKHPAVPSSAPGALRFGSPTRG